MVLGGIPWQIQGEYSHSILLVLYLYTIPYHQYTIECVVTVCSVSEGSSGAHTPVHVEYFMDPYTMTDCTLGACTVAGSLLICVLWGTVYGLEVHGDVDHGALSHKADFWWKEIRRMQTVAGRSDQGGLLAGVPLCACACACACVCLCVPVCVCSLIVFAGRGLDETALSLLLLHKEEALSQRLLKRFIKVMGAFQQRMATAVGISMEALVDTYKVPEVGCDPRTLNKTVERNERELVRTMIVYWEYTVWMP